MSPGFMCLMPKWRIFAFTVSAMPRIKVGSPMPMEVRLHFLCHGEHAITNDLHDYRVGLALAGSSISFCSRGHRFAPPPRFVRFPYSQTVIRSPGFSTVVEACSSDQGGAPDAVAG